MERKNGKSYFIELLRFIFSIMVIIAHFKGQYSENILRGTWNGHIAVEFFFIVSGFLMTSHCFRARNISPPSVDVATWNYIKRKCLGIAPVYYFTLSFFVIRFYSMSDLHGIDLYTSITRLLAPILFLPSVGFKESINISYSWYIGSMMLSTVILFPLIYKGKKAFTRIAAPLIVILYCTWAIQTYDKLFMLQGEWLVLCFPSLIRAIGDTCAGVLAFELCQSIQSIGTRLRTPGKLLLTAANLSMFLIPFYWIINGLRGLSHPLVLMMFVLGTAITFSGQDYTVKINNNPVLASVLGYLGKLSLPLYLGQGIVFLYFPKNYVSSPLSLPLFLAACLFVSCIILHGSKIVTALLSAIMKRIIPLLIVPKA